MPDISLCIEDAGHRDQRNCLPGTREKILESIKLWNEDFHGPPVCLLNGLPGAGKSAIVRTVMEWCSRRGQLGSFFFCSSSTGGNRNRPLLIPSLAIQLAQQDTKVRSILAPILWYNPGLYESIPNQVQKLIVDPLRAADVPALIVIDALDEWMDGESQSTLLSTVKKLIGEIPKVKFLITSRPKTHILSRSSSLFFTGLAEFFNLEDAESGLIDTTTDIRVFLEHELAKLAAKRKLDNWPTPTQLDLLRDRAAGLFVYAVATVKFLDQNHTPPDEQYAIIEESPDDTAHEGTVEGVHKGLSLDSLCTSVLQASFGNVYEDAATRSVLATVALATRPLPLAGIAELVCRKFEEIKRCLGWIQSLLRVQGGLDQLILPFHKLLSDLLTSPTRCTNKRFYIAPGKFHSEIARNCLRLINETSPEAVVEHLPVKLVLNYACTSWYIHLAKSTEDVETLLPALFRFLQEGFKVWLIVLRALGEQADPVLALNETISWLRGVRLELLSSACKCLRASN